MTAVSVLRTHEELPKSHRIAPIFRGLGIKKKDQPPPPPSSFNVGTCPVRVKVKWLISEQSGKQREYYSVFAFEFFLFFVHEADLLRMHRIKLLPPLRK